MENLTVIIPYRDGAQTIERLLDSLPRDLPVIVVDDLSDKPFTSERANVKVVRGDTRGYFSGAVNTGSAACETDVLILNQDVWFVGDSFFSLLLEKRGEFGIIGDGVFGHPAFPNAYVQGTAMFVRRDVLTRVGGLNVQDFPLWGATADFQTRACRLGFKALPVRASEYGMRHERGDKPYGSSIVATLKNEPDRQSLFVRTPPLVSVIITSFNYGRFLTDAVNSLLGGETSLGKVAPQTFQAFEVVIVDDCSRDNTREVGERLADPWKGVRFIHRAVNGGSAAAVNTGIAAAYGKWIAVMDGDDMLEPSRLETLYRIAAQHPHHFVYDDLNYFARGRKYFVHRLPDYDFETTLHKNKIHKGIVFEKSAWVEVGGYPEEMKWGREDWAMNVRLGAHGYCGLHHPEPLYLYRREGQNRSLTNTDDVAWRARFVAQLHALYPALYAGERTKMCCGSTKTVKTQKANGNGGAQNLGVLGIAPGGMMIGQQGMTLLKYLPQKLGGGQQYAGPVTRQIYIFGGKRKTGYVDNRDVEKLLQLREGGKLVFARAAPEPAPAPTPRFETLEGREPEPRPDSLDVIVNNAYPVVTTSMPPAADLEPMVETVVRLEPKTPKAKTPRAPKPAKPKTPKAK